MMFSPPMRLVVSSSVCQLVSLLGGWCSLGVVSIHSCDYSTVLLCATTVLLTVLLYSCTYRVRRTDTSIMRLQLIHSVL